MTITDFSLLKTTDQLALLYADGVYLCKRKSSFMTILLYQIQDVYVEIYYTRYRRQVDRIECSQDIRMLDPYLDSIDIGDYFSEDTWP